MLVRPSSSLSIIANPSRDLSPRVVAKDAPVAKLSLAVLMSIFVCRSPCLEVSFKNFMDLANALWSSLSEGWLTAAIDWVGARRSGMDVTVMYLANAR